jgi:hypothetical protein
MKIVCPMCSTPLQTPGAIEEVSIEYSTLSVCGHCGFGLDLRWRGRGSALAKPTPEIIIVTSQTQWVDSLNQTLPTGWTALGVSSCLEALGIYARALRLNKRLLTIVITEPLKLSWAESALSIRALETGFKAPTTTLCFFAPHQPSEHDHQLLQEVYEIYWKECSPSDLSQNVAQSIHQLIAQPSQE